VIHRALAFVIVAALARRNPTSTAFMDRYRAQELRPDVSRRWHGR
jgi:hypothetical protein